MYLVQLFLPLYSNTGKRFSSKQLLAVRETLLTRYGGVTTYARTPVRGLWKSAAKRTQHDDLLIFEVMVKTLNRRWWHRYRLDLEKTFLQDQLLIRAFNLSLL